MYKPVQLKRVLVTSIFGAFPFFLHTLAHAQDRDVLQKAWDTLRAGVAEKDAEKRAITMRVLGLIPKNSKAVDIAEHGLEDDKPEVRASAATALGHIGTKESIAKLQQALSDNDTSVVLAAARSLLTLKDDSGYGVYYEILTGERKTRAGVLDKQLKMFKDPKELAQFGFEQGIGFVPFAGMGYTAFKVLTKDDVSPVRAAAAKTLARDPDPDSGKALAEAVADKSPHVRVAALEALGERGDAGLISAIEPALSDDKDEVRYTAARSDFEENRKASIEILVRTYGTSRSRERSPKSRRPVPILGTGLQGRKARWSMRG